MVLPFDSFKCRCFFELRELIFKVLAVILFLILTLLLPLRQAQLTLEKLVLDVLEYLVQPLLPVVLGLLGGRIHPFVKVRLRLLELLHEGDEGLLLGGEVRFDCRGLLFKCLFIVIIWS